MVVGISSRKRFRLIRWGAALGCALFLFWTDLPLNAEIQGILLYQQIGSPVAGLVSTCRFEPTCSHYALEQLRARGFWIGNARIAGRLALCSPLGALLDALNDDQPSSGDGPAG